MRMINNNNNNDGGGKLKELFVNVCNPQINFGAAAKTFLVARLTVQ